MSNKKVAYAQGYLDGLKEGGWSCYDCGNVYESSVEECPNRLIDQAVVNLRSERYRVES